MITITSVICAKCGRVEEIGKAQAEGWLVAQRVGKPEGRLIVRCPEDITDYARRQAGLTQEYYHEKKGKSKMYIVQHTGYPVAGRAIQDHEWKTYSKHTSMSAAFRAIERARAHLSPDTWDDHYRVIGPDGNIVDRQEYLDQQWEKDAARFARRFYKD
jgi:hypothetical protein